MENISLSHLHKNVICIQACHVCCGQIGRGETTSSSMQLKVSMMGCWMKQSTWLGLGARQRLNFFTHPYKHGDLIC